MSVARSCSGYLFVDPFANAFLFHAFYEAGAPLTATPADTPLLLWLQGDPGCSDLVSDLFELGPYLADAPDDSTLSRNPFTWTSPPSTRTTSPRPFFLSGESYAGKYVLAAGAAVVPWCPRTGSSRRRRRAPAARGRPGLGARRGRHHLGRRRAGVVPAGRHVQAGPVGVHALQGLQAAPHGTTGCRRWRTYSPPTPTMPAWPSGTGSCTRSHRRPWASSTRLVNARQRQEMEAAAGGGGGAH